VRGMHYQREPHSEVKLVRCAKGTICDVIIDIRPVSPTYLHWQNFELSGVNGLNYTSQRGSPTASKLSAMMLRSIISFPNATCRNPPAAFAMMIRFPASPGPCP
jgi:hypothetical protein